MAATSTAKERGGSSPPPRVKLRQGTYEGAARPPSALYPKALAAFMGVPYAQTTAGANRFRPPQPLPVPPPPPSADAEKAIIPAVAYGEACPGVTAPPPGIRTGEDCLNANVFVPAAALPPRHLLPVVVYVHGGGFNMGLGAERDMASFVAWAADDVVGVSFNYRVGPLGFLASPVAPADRRSTGGNDDEDDGVLNVGLRDQQMLFGWVADNIAAFGGDPANVTVMGLSAGAHSIGHHLIHYGAPDKRPAPFHKAILESGAATARSVLYPTHPRNAAQYREFLAAAGVVAGGGGGGVLSRLRALPLRTILAAGRAVWDAYLPTVCWPFQPVIDADVIPDLPIRSWRAGRVLDVPVITGFNTNEGTSFVPARADSDADFRIFFARLLPAAAATAAGRSDLDRLAVSLYPDPVSVSVSVSSSTPAATTISYLSAPTPKGMGRQWRRLDAAYADYAYTCPVLQTAHYMSQLQQQHKRKDGRGRSRVYVYHFAPLSPPWGTANHAENAPFAAHDLTQLLGLRASSPVAASSKGGEHKLFRATEARLPGVVAASAAMHAAYVRFVVSRDGDPNPDPGSGERANGTAAKAAGLLRHWPAFESPFTGGTVAAPELVRAADDDDDAAGGRQRGRLVVFGEGNEERMPRGPDGGSDNGSRRGTAARVVALSERELELCRFWWERVELSQGAGTRLGEGGPVRYKANL